MGNSFEEIIGVLAGVFSFVAFVLYYLAILRGETRPNRATWIILTIVGVLIASSYYASGARETMWIAISYVVGPLIAALLSLKYGEGGWNRFDLFCLAGCLVSVVFWWISEQPALTLAINIFIDFLGILPTLKKSYLDPLSEDKIAWSVTSLSNFLNIFAVGQWTFAIGFYPLYMLFVNGLITFFLFFRGHGLDRGSALRLPSREIDVQ